MSGANDWGPAWRGGILTTRLGFAMDLRYFKDVSGGFRDADFLKFSGAAGKCRSPLLSQAAHDLNCQILGGRHGIAECGHFHAQVSVMEGLQHLCRNQPVECLRVQYAPGTGIHGSTSAHGQFVVMAVAEWVIALAIGFTVFVRR